MSKSRVLVISAIDDCALCKGTGLIKSKVTLPYGQVGSKDYPVRGQVLCSCVTSHPINSRLWAE